LKSIFTKTLFINIALALGIVMVLLLIVNWSLGIYTRHGQSLEVPSVKGKSMQQAIDILDDANLEYKILDSAFMADMPPSSVLEQTPRAGTKVKQGRTIYLTVNSFNAPTVEVPDLVGKSSFKYAKMQLESYGLKVGEPIFQASPHQNALLDILVNGKSVGKNAKLPKGTLVTLVIGQGVSSEEIQIPYLIGLSYTDAMQKLRNEFSLSLGALVVDDGVSDTTNAIVYRQSPDFKVGRKIRVGEELDLFVAKELPADITVNPDFYNIQRVDSTSGVENDEAEDNNTP
jgi:beta-lactam-binding protein with PASTA domain